MEPLVEGCVLRMGGQVALKEKSHRVSFTAEWAKKLFEGKRKKSGEERAGRWSQSEGADDEEEETNKRYLNAMRHLSVSTEQH